MPVFIYEKRDHVAYLTMNRPEVLNAQNHELSEAMHNAWLNVRDDPDVWVAIVTGAGRSFSAGHDIKELNSEGRNPPPRSDRLSGLQGLKVWKPVIAAIDGYAIGGGLGLAMQCDIRICTERSLFAYSDYRLGRMPGLTPMAANMAYGNALYMLCTGAQINAQDAYRWGLVYRVLPDRESLMQEAQRIAEEVKLSAPLAVQAAKRAFYESRGQPPEYVERLVRALEPLILQTEDALEGPRAFVEKRKPVWKAR